MDQYGKPLLILNLLIDDKYVSDTFRIDTGFDGELAIPKDIVERYRIQYHGYIGWKLPTGQKVEFPLIKTKIMLNSKIIETKATVIKVRPGLVGTALLRKITRVMLLDFDDAELKIWLKNQ